MNRQTLFAFALSAPALCACTSDEETVFSLSDNPQAIKINTYVGQSTRALDKTAFETGDVIGLYACQTTGDYANVFSAGFMNNVAVTKGESDWTYSPVATWPADDNEHLSFIAFYPRVTTGTATTYQFTVNDDPAQQTDPLWCTIRDASINDRNGKFINGSETDAAFEATSGALNLKFKHMLSKVKVYVKLDSEYPGIDVKLKSLGLRNIRKSGTFTINPSLASGYWGSYGTSEVFSLFSSDEDAINVTNEATKIGEDLLMIPQSTNGKYIRISYGHTLAEGGDKSITKDFYFLGSWEQNKTYIYTINLSLDVNNITITADIEDGYTEMEDNPIIIDGDTKVEAVDLGLSVKWANFDYGTISPYVSGTTYNYNYYNMSFDDTWGKNRSVPTQAQWTELFSKCTITNTTVNGVSGYLVTGPSGNSIFFRGVCYWTSSMFSAGVYPNTTYYHYYVSLSEKM